MAKRKSLPLETRSRVLHEAGYKCANPSCRTILTLDIHHLDYVSEGGTDSPDNLIALCPNCHTLHHKGYIPKDSLLAWKFVLLSLNEGFDRRSVDILLLLADLSIKNDGRSLPVSGDGLLTCASLIVSGLVAITLNINNEEFGIELTEKGKLLVAGWKQGKMQFPILS